jgi:hypothetical protein
MTLPPNDISSNATISGVDGNSVAQPSPTHVVAPDILPTPPTDPPSSTKSLSDRTLALAAALVMSIFFFFVFFYYPKTVQPVQYAILTLFATFLSGFVGYLVSGAITADVQWQIPGGPSIKINAVGGFAFALVGLFVFLHFSSIAPVGQSATVLNNQLTNKFETPLISTAPSNGQLATSPSAKISPQTKNLALQIASADHKYSYLSALAGNNVSAQELGTIIAKLQGSSTVAPKPQLEGDFGSGVSTFAFGSSTYAVVDQLAGIVPRYPWENLVHASEYNPADVRYFTTSLKSLGQTEVGKELLSKLPDTSACFSGQSYIVFLFSADQLIRVVTRLTPDCVERQSILKGFADKYGLPFNANSAVLFQQSTQSTTVGGYVSSDSVFSLDIFKNGTPNPGRN